MRVAAFLSVLALLVGCGVSAPPAVPGGAALEFGEEAPDETIGGVPESTT